MALFSFGFELVQLFLVLVLAEHGIVICKFGFDLFLVVLDLRHETHIDEAVDLMLLILRPNILRPTLFLFLPFSLPFCLDNGYLFHHFPFLLSFFAFLRLIFLAFLLLLDPLGPEIILKELLLMPFQDLMLLDLMVRYFFNNLFDECRIDSPALHVAIDVVVGVPIGI